MKPKQRFWVSVTVLCLMANPVLASEQDSGWTDRQKYVVGGLSAGYVGGFTALYQLWYKNYNTGKFHFFNDNAEWAQMDKVAHVYATYAEAKYSQKLLHWSGFDRKTSVLLGTGSALLFQTTIEVFDGFSEGWGASTGDILANFAGTGIYLGQEMLWEEQRFAMKFTYRQTKYPPYRPDLLGSTFDEQIIKDYNGQTYWLSANIASFLKEDTKMPKWLNVAFGYGIDGFLSGRAEDQARIFPNNPDFFPRMRIFYLSPDIDLEKIKVKSKALRITLSILSNFKFPLPALSLSQSGKVEILQFGF